MDSQTDSSVTRATEGEDYAHIPEVFRLSEDGKVS